MATNTGSNGGKNNTGEIRAGANLNQGSGINAALNQANYRREYNEKMFSDNGYLNSSIKNLEAQAKELDRILEKSKQLTQAEKNRYSKMSADMKKLAAEQNEMFTKQEASSKELQSTLNESSKLRLKAVDELYRQYMKKEKDLNDAGKKQVENKIRQFAAASREIKADVEDINEATKNFDNAKKSLADGVGEFVDNLQQGLSDFSKVLNLQNIAENDWIKKANERYEIMNKINSQLGYSASESTRTYNTLVNSFADFNKNMDNLFSTEDLKEYIKNSDTFGVHNEKLLQENLRQSIIASEYLGVTSETQTSMYKYMRLTNNNDSIAKYNKTMIALQKEGIGVNTDIYNKMLQDDMSMADVLSMAGLTGEQIEQFNQDKEDAIVALQKEYSLTDSQASQLSDMFKEAVEKLGSPDGSGQAELFQSWGVNPNNLNNAMANVDAKSFLNEIITGLNSRNNTVSSNMRGNPMGSMMMARQLGISDSNANLARTLGTDAIKNVEDTIEGIKSAREKTSEDEMEQYVKNNEQLSWVSKTANSIQAWLEKQGASWLNFETLGTVAFGLYIGSTGIKLASKGWGLLTGALGKEGLFGKMFSSGSEVGQQLSLFNSGKTAAGSGLGKLAAGLAVVGLTAAAIKGIADAASKTRNETYGRNYDNNLKELTGTRDSGNTSVASSNTLKDATNSVTWFGDVAGNIVESFKRSGNLLFNAKGYERNRSLAEYIYNSGGFGDRDATTAFAMLMDYGGSLDALNEALGTNYSREGLQKYYWGQLLDDRGEKLYSNLRLWIEQKGEGGYTSNGKPITNSADVVSWLNDEYLQKVDNKVLENWEKNEYIKGEGYHLAGLNRVPKDNYRALLHKDEMVLNKAEAERYRAILGKRGYGFGGSLNASAPDYVGAHHSGYTGHNGIDLYFSEVGTPVGSAVPGKVIESRDIPVDWNDGRSYHGADSNGTHYSSYGKVVKVRGDDGHTYIYGHLNERVVKAGDQVGAGTLLGYSGTTGNSSGPHLHFEVADAGKGEAAHAKYYTPYVRSANGAAAQAGVSNTNSGDTNSDGSRRGAILATVNSSGVRAIPSFGGGSTSSGPSSTDRIVKSVDGVSDKIIKYLDEIRQEQADQRRLINAFSASQTSIENYR